MISSNHLFLLTLCPLLGLADPVAAATLTVNDTCSLVQAIQAAETDSPVGGCTAGDGADGIVLTADVVLDAPLLDRNGPTGLPVIASTIRIDGNGYTIRRAQNAPRFRLFYIDAGDLTLENLTLANGLLDGADGSPGENGAPGTPGGPGVNGGEGAAGSPGESGESGGRGAALYVDSGRLVLRNCEIRDHSVNGGAGGDGGHGGDGGDGERGGNGGLGGNGAAGGHGGAGAGVYATNSQIRIEHSRFIGNQASGGTGGGGGDGGDGGDSLADPPTGIDAFQTPRYGYWAGDGLPGSGGIGGQGGALSVLGGSLTIVASEFIHNRVDGSNAGLPRLPLTGQTGNNAFAGRSPGISIHVAGSDLSGSGGQGIIQTTAPTLIRDSVFVGNSASGGTAALNFLLMAWDTNQSFPGDVGGHGGASGIVFHNDIEITGSTFYNNHADGGDGADDSDGENGPLIATSPGKGGSGVISHLSGGCANIDLDYTARIINSTFSTNTANGGKGGDGHTPDGHNGGAGGTALFVVEDYHFQALHLSLVGNEAQGGAGGTSPGMPGTDGDGGSLLRRDPQCQHPSTLTLGNSLLAANQGALCVGEMLLAGNNFADTSDCGIVDGLSGVDPVLADHGGFTPTHALLPDSNARDAADSALCEETGGVDQRGWARDPPATGACDIGAFEYNPVRLFGHGFE